jgi:hypothetical protein
MNPLTRSHTTHTQPHQRQNPLTRLLRRRHNPKLRIHRQRRDNTRIHHVQVTHAHHLGIRIHTRPDPTTAAPMTDLPARIRRPRGNISFDFLARGILWDVHGRETRGGKPLEYVVDEGADVAGVARVGVVDVAGGAGDEVVVEDDVAGGEEAGCAVDVEGDGVAGGEVGEAGWTDGSLHWKSDC